VKHRRARRTLVQQPEARHSGRAEGMCTK
jgi:hypothetical protein